MSSMAISDTTPRVAKLQAEILKSMSGTERLRLAIDMSDVMRALTFARLTREHPGSSQRDLVRQFLRCLMSADQIPAFLR